MMNALPVVLWCLAACGLTALFVSLAWYAPLHRSRQDADVLADRLADEVAAHDATRLAHINCLDDCRRHGISGAMRRHPSSHLRRVK